MQVSLGRSVTTVTTNKSDGTIATTARTRACTKASAKQTTKNSSAIKKRSILRIQ
jgi:hypothetical protein